MRILKFLLAIFIITTLPDIAFAEEKLKVFATGLSIPGGIACDNADNIYIAEWGGRCVHKSDADGNEVLRYTNVGDPSGVCFDDDGNFYVASYSYGVVHRFEKGDMKRQSVYASGFDVPAGVNWIEGSLFVANRDAGEIVKVEGKKKAVIARNLPQPVCFQKVGSSYIISCLSGAIYKMENVNATPKVLCPEIKGSGINIVADGDGFFICVIEDGTVERISLDGKRTVIAEGYGTPLGIARTKNGNLIFASWDERSAFVLELK